MTDSPKPGSTGQDELIADMKILVADAQEFLHATADQVGETVNTLRTRLLENLKSAQVRLEETDNTLIDGSHKGCRPESGSGGQGRRRQGIGGSGGNCEEAKDAIG